MDLSELTDEEFRAKMAEVLTLSRSERQENQLAYFKPVSAVARQVWESKAQVVGVGGGNRAGKTDGVLAMVSACATGVFPDEMRHLIPTLFRGPIRVRVICESLTTALYPVILPKLQWNKWSGLPPNGGDKGHWGWIPPRCLKNRQWEASWSDKLRILTVKCFDPMQPDVLLGESMFHFMSYDQEEGKGTDFHYVIHDEPPPLHVWRESQARVMGVGGRLFVVMTWPDDPSVPVDWLFDEVYEPGMDPNNKQVEWYNIFSTDNRNIDQEAVAAQAAKWTEETRRVRIFGQPIRFSNRIHPLFTDQTMHWCFRCGKTAFLEENKDGVGEYDRFMCSGCHSTEVCDFNHVHEFEIGERWPVMWVLDPHPRKPHMAMWVAIDPYDDLWQIDEVVCEGDPTDLKVKCDEIEERHGMEVALRLIDPNMGRSPSSSKRKRVWQDEFNEAGLVTELADDSEAGRKVLNQYLKPEEHRQQPRVHVHSRCTQTIFQIKRYVWDDYKRTVEKDQKQEPKAKNDDFPTMWKYLMNYHPTFGNLRGIGAVVRRPGTRRGAY